MNSRISQLGSQPNNLLAIIASLSVIVIGWNIYTIILMVSEMDNIIHRAEEVAELEETLVFLLKQEVAEKQYLVTGDLEPRIHHGQFEVMADFHLDRAERFQSNSEDLALILEIRDERGAYEATFAQIVKHYDNKEIDEAIRLSFEEAQVFVQRAQDKLEAFVIRVAQNLETEVGRTDQLAQVSLIAGLVLLVVFLGIAFIALSIKNRVQKSILLLSVLISLVIVGWNVYNILELKGEVRDVVTHLEELDQVELTEIYLLEQEIAGLNYLLSGDEAYIDRHRDLEKTTDEHWNLAVSLQTTADEVALLDALKQDHDTYEQIFNEIVTVYQQGNKTEAIRLSVQDAAASLDDVQKRVDEFIIQTELKLEDELAQIEQLTPVSLTIGVFTLILLMMETIIFTTATTRVEIKQLRIEIDQIKRQKQVGDIEDTEFFQDLQAKANKMRRKNDNKE